MRVKVAEDVFESLTAADFEATVDLDGLTVGEYRLPVTVRTLHNRGGLRIDEVLPEEIDVELAQLTSKEVPVVIDVQGEPPAGFSMGAPEPENLTVFVTGPQDKVDLVAQANAVIDVAARAEEINQAVRLAPRDNTGELVVGVALDPTITEVKIPIEQEKFSRSLAVSVETSGQPADGYNVVAVSSNPPSVTVSGEQDFIDNAVTIRTNPVDISGATDDVVRSVSLDLDGAEVTGGVPIVTVTVKIEPAVGVLSYQVPVTAVNLPADLAVQGPLPSVLVTLQGELPTLRGLTPNDIVARVDLAGRVPGVHLVGVEASSPAATTVQGISPPQIEITLGPR